MDSPLPLLAIEPSSLLSLINVFRKMRHQAKVKKHYAEIACDKAYALKFKTVTSLA